MLAPPAAGFGDFLLQIRSLPEISSPEPAGKVQNPNSRSKNEEIYVFILFNTRSGLTMLIGILKGLLKGFKTMLTLFPIRFRYCCCFREGFGKFLVHFFGQLPDNFPANFHKKQTFDKRLNSTITPSKGQINHPDFCPGF